MYICNYIFLGKIYAFKMQMNNADIVTRIDYIKMPFPVYSSKYDAVSCTIRIVKDVPLKTYKFC